MKAFATIVLSLSLLTAVLAPPAAAAPGDLDPTFSGDWRPDRTPGDHRHTPFVAGDTAR